MNEYEALLKVMTDWRNEDHWDNLTLSRHNVIVLLEGIKQLFDPPIVIVTGDKKWRCEVRGPANIECIHIDEMRPEPEQGP